MAIVLALPVMFIDRTFQVAILVTALGLKGLRPMVSFRLWPPDIMLLLRKGPFLPTANDIVLLRVSVISYLPLNGWLAYPKVPGVFVKTSGCCLPHTGHWPVEFYTLIRPLPLSHFCNRPPGPWSPHYFFHSWNGWFDFRVFLLLDELPFRAHEPHLPFYRCRTI